MKLRFLPLLALLLLPLMAQAKLQTLDRIVAVVNSDVITQSQLDQQLGRIKQRMQRQQQPLPPGDILKQQVLEHAIVTSIQLQLAKRAGIKIDDTRLHNILSDIAQRNQLTLEQFANKIRAEGSDWQAFRERIRRQTAISQLRHMQVGKRVHVSEREIDQFLKSAQGKKLFSYDLHLAHIIIQVPSKASPDEIDQAHQQAQQLADKLQQGASFTQAAIHYSDAADALKGGDLGWRPASQLPGLYTQASGQLQPGEVSQPLKAGNGFHIVKLLGRRGNSGKQVITQYKVRHILIESNTLRSPAEAKALAQKLHDQIAAGASFAKLAKQYSDDPGSGAKGGELGWVSKGQMVPSFEDAMLNTPEGKLSPVFHSQYGWHFLEVEASRQADMSDEYRRMQAANALRQRYYEQQLQLWLRKIRAEAYVDIRL